MIDNRYANMTDLEIEREVVKRYIVLTEDKNALKEFETASDIVWDLAIRYRPQKFVDNLGMAFTLPLGNYCQRCVDQWEGHEYAEAHIFKIQGGIKTTVAYAENPNPALALCIAWLLYQDSQNQN